MRLRTKFADARATAPGDAARGQSSAALITILFFVLAPGTVAGYIPRRISRWRVLHPPWDPTLLRALGVLLISAGAAGLVECFVRFVRQGRGTPAPVFPTERLIVSGLYRWVRNPMYAAVLALLIGQALWFGNVSVLIYAAGAWLVTHLFVCFYEEPTLHRAYGEQYDAWRAHVPRWLPRLTPWKSP
ncbi:MAG: isoprenylcysteine carboxylmethyltransferase family protein [Acidobacteriaceae bacterium]